jgi:hypothetical protein
LRPIFIGGCGRSGTTLLGAMLGTHPLCLATPESRFRFREEGREDLAAALRRIVEHWSFGIWGVALDTPTVLARSGSFPALVLQIVEAYGRKVGRTGCTVWIDHTPGNVKHASSILAQFPEARLIHLVRDGRATAASVIDLDWGPNTVVHAARWWVENVTRGLDAELLHGPERVRRVVYERLVAEPEETLQGLCPFLGLDYRPEMVEGTGFHVPGFTAAQHRLVGQRPDPRRREAWRNVLAPREVEIVESIACDLLVALGYEPVYGWKARPATVREMLAFALEELYRRHVVNRVRLRRRIGRSVPAGERA